MSEPALTRADLALAVNNSMGLSLNDCGDLVDTVLETVSESLEKGEQVKIIGFGTFTVRDKNARMGRNPKTKKHAVITPRRVVGFRASTGLKSAMNQNKK